jgi:hypothetical protein
MEHGLGRVCGVSRRKDLLGLFFYLQNFHDQGISTLEERMDLKFSTILEQAPRDAWHLERLGPFTMRIILERVYASVGILYEESDRSHFLRLPMSGRAQLVAQALRSYDIYRKMMNAPMDQLHGHIAHLLFS